MPLKFLKKSRQYNVMSKDLYVITISCLGESKMGEKDKINISHSFHSPVALFRINLICLLCVSFIYNEPSKEFLMNYKVF